MLAIIVDSLLQEVVASVLRPGLLGFAGKACTSRDFIEPPECGSVQSIGLYSRLATTAMHWHKEHQDSRAHVEAKAFVRIGSFKFNSCLHLNPPIKFNLMNLHFQTVAGVPLQRAAFRL
eukprot:1157461-Pelagomonas_calceolata.AAC.1